MLLMKRSCSVTSTSLKTSLLLCVRVSLSPSHRDVGLHADLLFIVAQNAVRLSRM